MTARSMTNEERTKILRCESGVVSRTHNVGLFNAVESFVYPYYGVHFEGGSIDLASNTFYMGFSGIPGTGYDIVAKKVKEHFGIPRLYVNGSLVR